MELRTLTPGKRCYRGNLHTHTSVSDGRKSPDEAVRWYRENGYDFVAITDHWKPAEASSRDGILVVPGVEFDGIDPELGMYHVVGLDITTSPEKGGLVGPDAVVSYIAGQGGLAVLCHPYWCGMPSWAVGRVEGVFAVEVFNSTCEVHIAKGLSSVHWDDTLASGKRLWGVAVDDTHWGRHDYGGGWVMVQADDLSIPSLREALLSGRFYASSGPDIHDFVVDGGRAYARTSEASRIAFICDAHRGRCLFPENGDAITEGEYVVPDTATYIRLEVTDRKGRKAWSNPLFLK